MKIRSDTYSLIGTTVLMLVFIVLALRMEHFYAKVIPLIIGGASFLLAAAALVRDILRKKAPETTEAGVEVSSGDVLERGSQYLIVVAWGAGLLLALYLFGFLIAAALFVLSVTKLSGTRWWIAAVFAILVPAFIFGIFELALQIELYRGIFLT